jgi:twitching motility protein PilT
MARIDELLQLMADRGASDLHLTTTLQPYMRVDGDMEAIDAHLVLTPDANKGLLYEIMADRNRVEFDERFDTDFAYELENVGRFRVNVFRDHFGIGGVLRLIPSKILTVDQLNLPKAVRDFCFMPKGLVVVTGPTGSGKSTTLAAMIDLINKSRSDHIITIEDPIEFLHKPQKCLINQREVHTHTRSFAAALRAALREDPDIVLVGEMRDLETVETALETAETGHLVFGTLHTTTAASTIDRIIDMFPADRQNQVRTMLAVTLKGVVAQTLLKKKPKGRVAALEILVGNTAISNYIREGKTFQIPSAMQTGKNVGMQILNDSLLQLVTDGGVDPQEAYLKAIEKTDLAKKFERAGIKFLLGTESEKIVSSAPVPAAEPASTRSLEETIAGYIEKLRSDPNNIDVVDHLAWILATSANEKVRNPALALQMAEKAFALTKGQQPVIMDTLGAAYAAIGKFDRALNTARKGLQLAMAKGDRPLAETFQERIALYESRQPVRE